MDEIDSDGGFDSYSSVFKTSWSYAGNYNLTDAGRFTETAGSSWLTWTDNSSDTTRGNITALAIAPNTGGSCGKVFIYNDQGGSYAPGWREVWTSTSDGSGSGLDADLLDGCHASAFQAAGTYNTIIGTDSDINTSGATVVDQLNMTDGVIQSHSTRTLTLANLGYTGATNANYITNNNQLTNGAGYTTCTGTGVGNITCITTSTGLDGGGSSGTVNITMDLTEITLGAGLDSSATGLSLDLSELTDMTGGICTTQDELILLDNGAERRKLFSEIFGCNAYNSTCIATNNNQLTNGAGYTTCTGTLTTETNLFLGDGGSLLTAPGTNRLITQAKLMLVRVVYLLQQIMLILL